MDDVLNQLAHELGAIMAKAIEKDPDVSACEEKIRKAGFDPVVQLAFEIGFRPKIAINHVGTMALVCQPTKSPGISSNDKRFLRSLRIAFEEEPQEETE